MYLHNGDYKPTTTFEDSDCHKDWVYVDGLYDGLFLSSDNPYLLQKDNGVIVSLDQSFSYVNLNDQDGSLIETINLNFITTCTRQENQWSQSDNELSLNQSTNQSHFFLVLSLFALLLIGIIFVRFLKQNN